LRRIWLLGCILLLLATAACAEDVRIQTPGGKLNARKAADSQSGIAFTIANHSLVSLEELQGDWARITYKKKTGYVKTEFLLLPSALVGETVYTDGETALLYLAPDTNAALCGILSPLDPVTVLSLEDAWAQVQSGSQSGWMQLSALSWQRKEPEGTPEWIPLRGRTVMAVTADPNQAHSISLESGTPVTVTQILDDRCLVQTDSVMGYIPVHAVALAEDASDWNPSETMTPSEALEKAAAALKKRFRTFSKQKLYSSISRALPQNLYHCLYLNEDDQVLYGALVDPSTARVLLTASYADFAVPVPESNLLPYAELRLDVSADRLRIGEILDCTVQAWTNASCIWSLQKDGKVLLTSEDTGHFHASYRPRTSGEYTISVTVTDPDGLSKSTDAEFTVLDESVPEALCDVYSQKDGWWADKAYRKSTLEQSGCAIFTLSHALNRLGFEGDDILPENLARTYALCLTVDGTNNERLILESSAQYGLTTRRNLIEDKTNIASLLRSGGLFSFSIARGHIALIDGLSADGTMVHIVDSAPSATYERIVNTEIYIEKKEGLFRSIRSLDDIAGARWYLDTEAYGGLEYWMPLEYAARRGVRLIQRP